MSRPDQESLNSKPKSVFKRRLMITSLAVAMSLGPVQSVTAGPAIDEYVHTIKCIGLLITDEIKHLEECGTNDNLAGPSLDLSQGAPAATPPPPPPPEPEPEPEPEQEAIVVPQEGDSCSSESEQIDGEIVNGVCVFPR